MSAINPSQRTIFIPHDDDGFIYFQDLQELPSLKIRFINGVGANPSGISINLDQLSVEERMKGFVSIILETTEYYKESAASDSLPRKLRTVSCVESLKIEFWDYLPNEIKAEFSALKTEKQG